MRFLRFKYRLTTEIKSFISHALQTNIIATQILFQNSKQDTNRFNLPYI